MQLASNREYGLPDQVFLADIALANLGFLQIGRQFLRNQYHQELKHSHLCAWHQYLPFACEDTPDSGDLSLAGYDILRQSLPILAIETYIFQ